MINDQRSVSFVWSEDSREWRTMREVLEEYHPLGTDLSHFGMPLTSEECMWIKQVAGNVWDSLSIENVERSLELAFKRGKKIGREDKT